jgi:hypothetical protein
MRDSEGLSVDGQWALDVHGVVLLPALLAGADLTAAVRRAWPAGRRRAPAAWKLLHGQHAWVKSFSKTIYPPRGPPGRFI